MPFKHGGRNKPVSTLTEVWEKIFVPEPQLSNCVKTVDFTIQAQTSHAVMYRTFKYSHAT